MDFFFVYIVVARLERTQNEMIFKVCLMFTPLKCIDRQFFDYIFPPKYLFDGDFSTQTACGVHREIALFSRLAQVATMTLIELRQQTKAMDVKTYVTGF